MTDKQQNKLSKFLSFVLRHKPGAIGLFLTENGWAHTEELIAKASAHNMSISLEQLKVVVANSDKQRFSLSEDFQQIKGTRLKLTWSLKLPCPLFVFTMAQQTETSNLYGSRESKSAIEITYISASTETQR